MLKLNQEKTELIIFNTKHKSRKMTEDIQLQVCEKSICVTESVKMKQQVNAIPKDCYYDIRNVGDIRRYVTRNAYKTLANALLISRLDNG